MGQELGKFITKVVIGNVIFHACDSENNSNYLIKNECVDVCTDNPCNNERTQLSMEHGSINIARLLCAFVRLFKCSY
jgi:hypothetical protein